LSDISVNTIYKLERGQGNPSLEIIQKLMDVLGLELNIEVKKVNK
jgi:transcriptional regulator with XRE-family HTH domain